MIGRRYAALGLSWLSLILWNAAAEAASREAERQVRQGLQAHAAGDYAAAAESFEKAAAELPDELRITFDQACVLASQGKDAEAAAFFQRSAASPERQLAAASHYNLGCLAARQAKGLFGERPEEAAPQTREQGLQLLQQAVGHFRDCLQTDPGHQAARRNLELLRLWAKHMQDLWAQRDRQRRRDEMPLLEFLLWLENEQRALEAGVKVLEATASSPRQRQAIAQTEQQQRLLSEEIEPLQRKLQQAAATAAPSDPSALAQIEQATQAMTLPVKAAMLAAADELAARSLPAARAAQSKAVVGLDEVYRVAAPFDHLLQRATETERNLVGWSQSAVAGLTASHSPTVAAPPTDPEAMNSSPDGAVIDPMLASRDQHFVAGWSEMLPEKAREVLASLPTAEPEIDPNTTPEEQAGARAQQALRESLAKAIELSPRIVELTDEAASLVERQAWAEALPLQEEALRLLEEIAPRQPPQSPPPPDDSQENQQDPQEDRSKQPAPPSDDPQPPPPDDQQQPEQQEQQQEQQPQSRQPRPQPPDLSQQHAEALLRQVRQREREIRERRRELERLLQGTVPVEKDW